MGKLIDEIGNKYGLLTVIERDNTTTSKGAKWICQCQCGKKISLRGDTLRQNKTLSCGCQKINHNFKDITGQRFGKLTVLQRAEDYISTDGKPVVQWLCQCDCGNTKIIRGSSLRTGATKSCGKCIRADCIDETGNRYGKLLVLHKSTNARTNALTGAVWTCQCDCGEILDINGVVLRRPNGPKSCKSCSSKINLLHKKFGLLTVIEEQPKNYYKCQCECGNQIIVKAKELLRGHRTSCGCRKSVGETLVRELLSQNNIYFEEQKIFKSCYNPITNAFLRFDFYLPQYNTLIEYDGEYHYYGWMLDEDDLIKTQEKDKYKNQWCQQNNITLIRIPYWHKDFLVLEDLLPTTSKFIVEKNDLEEIDFEET